MIPQERMNVIHKESLCINCGAASRSATRWSPTRTSSARRRSRRRCASSATRATATKVERLEQVNGENGIWQCTRCYFCNERCPKGVDPRDAIAKLGAESIKEGIDRDMGAKHAKWFVNSANTTGWLRETELVPKTQGIVASIRQTKFALKLAQHGKVPLPFPPHVAENVKESRALYDLVQEQGRRARRGSSRASRRSARVEHTAATATSDPTTRALPEAQSARGSEAREEGRVLQGLSRVALGEGARLSTQALAPKVGLELIELESVTCCGAGDIHEAEPDYYLHLNARILAYAEATGCDTLMTVCNVCTLNLRQANCQLQGDAELRERVNDNLAKVGVPAYEGDVDVQHFLWLVAEGEGYELLQAAAHKGLKGLKIAPFYGCQILRPSKLLGFEDPDSPSSLERIIEACGGEAIDYPAKIKCCGFPIIQAREETALGELIQPIEQAMEAGADAMVTPVPALPPLARRVAGEAEEADRQGLPDADPAPVAADRRRRRARGVGAEVQAPRRLRAARAREIERLIARFRPLRRLHEWRGGFGAGDPGGRRP